MPLYDNRLLLDTVNRVCFMPIKTLTIVISFDTGFATSDKP